MPEETRIAFQSEFYGSPSHQYALGDTALLIVDMDYLDTHPAYGVCRRAREAGADIAYYQSRIALAVANTAKLLEAFRARRMEVIFSRIMCLTGDGRDRSSAHKNAGILSLPGSREAMILEEIAPRDGELLFSKTVSSVFVGTNIEYVLRNVGIRTLVVTGVLTSGCVEAAVRDAFDRNYQVILVEDACADLVRSFHENAVQVLRVAAVVTTTKEVLRALRDLDAVCKNTET
jgi:nicotinamidase-related amidase